MPRWFKVAALALVWSCVSGGFSPAALAYGSNALGYHVTAEFREAGARGPSGEEALTADARVKGRWSLVPVAGLLFQAHLYDYETGLYLMRARVYDPRTGSFLQRDPEGFVDSVNPYAGMAWDPINKRDPTGRDIGDGAFGFAVGLAMSERAGQVLAGAEADCQVCGTEVIGGIEGGQAVRKSARSIVPIIKKVVANPSGETLMTAAVVIVPIALQAATSRKGRGRRASPALPGDPYHPDIVAKRRAASEKLYGQKPVERVYEHNRKHGETAYRDSRGRVVSRKPRGDCQNMLDCSKQKKATSPAREGIEPTTGKKVEFKRHLVQETVDRIKEFFHGFVPE